MKQTHPVQPTKAQENEEAMDSTSEVTEDCQMLLQDDDSSLNISAVMAPSAESLATYEEHAKGFPAPPTRKSHHKKRPSLEGSQDSPKRRGRPRKASVGLMQQSLDAWLTKPDLPVSMEAQETVALNVLASGVDTKKTVAPILTSAGAPVSPTKRGPGRPRKIQLAPELPMDIPVPVDAQAMAPLMGTEILGKKRGRRPKEDKGDESVLTREIGYSSQLVVTPSVMSTVSSLSLNPLASEDSTLYSHYRFGQSAMQGRGMAVPFSDNQRIARANLANSEPTFSLGKTQPVENKEQFSVGMRMCLNCGTDVTPMWRHGPSGFDPLCNSCGVKWKRGRIALNGEGCALLRTKLASGSNQYVARGNLQTNIKNYGDNSTCSGSSSEDEVLPKKRKTDKRARNSLPSSQPYNRDFSFSDLHTGTERSAYLASAISSVPKASLGFVAGALHQIALRIHSAGANRDAVHFCSNSEFEIDFGRLSVDQFCDICDIFIDFLP